MKKGMLVLITMVAILIAGGLYHTRVNAANTFLAVQKGMIYQAYVEYMDSDTVTVTTGYGECNGHYWEITEPIEHDMTSLTTAEDFHYIYIDDANSIYADPIIIDSTDEPAWSNSKLGWYNGNNRCIGVVWSSSGSATIMSYIITSDLKWVANTDVIKRVVNDNAQPDGTWHSVDCSNYIPVNAQAIRVASSNTDYDGYCRVEVITADSPNSKMSASSYGGYATARAWLELPRGSSRGLLWNGLADDDSRFGILICGYQIER